MKLDSTIEEMLLEMPRDYGNLKKGREYSIEDILDELDETLDELEEKEDEISDLEDEVEELKKEIAKINEDNFSQIGV